MRRTFIETSAFQKRIDRVGATVLDNIQTELLKNPDAGKVIPGTGGLRKLRIADPSRSKGKRGGYRAIYLDITAVEQIYLLALYDKDEKDDISQDEKRILKTLVRKLKEEAQ
ncbi:MAG: type II toxin-antitoxin system RelE/ParE family toxin [Elusimicrobiota bacterium]